jgi:hypothetical protein
LEVWLGEGVAQLLQDSISREGRVSCSVSAAADPRGSATPRAGTTAHDITKADPEDVETKLEFWAQKKAERRARREKRRMAFIQV